MLHIPSWQDPNKLVLEDLTWEENKNHQVPLSHLMWHTSHLCDILSF